MIRRLSGWSSSLSGPSYLSGGGESLPPFLSTERAEKLGQSLTRIPYKDTFWKGTTRTRPRKRSFPHRVEGVLGVGDPGRRSHPRSLCLGRSSCSREFQRLRRTLETWPLFLPGNGTLNKLAGIDFRQLSLGHKLNENQSGEVLNFPSSPAQPPPSAQHSWWE